jgi:hypothetical protein
MCRQQPRRFQALRACYGLSGYSAGPHLSLSLEHRRPRLSRVLRHRRVVPVDGKEPSGAAPDRADGPTSRRTLRIPRGVAIPCLAALRLPAALWSSRDTVAPWQTARRKAGRQLRIWRSATAAPYSRSGGPLRAMRPSTPQGEAWHGMAWQGVGTTPGNRGAAQTARWCGGSRVCSSTSTPDHSSSSAVSAATSGSLRRC